MYLKLCLRINSETEYGSNRTNQVIDQVTAIMQNKYLIIYTYTLFNIIFLLTCYKCQNGSVTAEMFGWLKMVFGVRCLGRLCVVLETPVSKTLSPFFPVNKVVGLNLGHSVCTPMHCY